MAMQDREQSVASIKPAICSAGNTSNVRSLSL